MTVLIRLDGGDPLARIGDLEHGILIGVQMYQTGSLGGRDAHFDIIIGQTAGVVAEAHGNEVSFSPILHKSFRGVIVILQSARDFPPGNRQAALDVRYCRSPIASRHFGGKSQGSQSELVIVPLMTPAAYSTKKVTPAMTRVSSWARFSVGMSVFMPIRPRSSTVMPNFPAISPFMDR